MAVSVFAGFFVQMFQAKKELQCRLILQLQKCKLMLYVSFFHDTMSATRGFYIANEVRYDNSVSKIRKFVSCLFNDAVSVARVQEACMLPKVKLAVTYVYD